MSKCIYICSKSDDLSNSYSSLVRICEAIAPDNIIPQKPSIKIDTDCAYAIMNPSSGIQERDMSILLGKTFDGNGHWNIPMSNFPDGTYAIFRNSKDFMELVSDSVASRTIWYFHDSSQFIASTSQRAIIIYLRSYIPDKRVIPWMLSSGSLGPQYSWDRRITRVPPDSAVILNKIDWTISTNSSPIKFAVVNRSTVGHEKLLRESLDQTFNNLDIDLVNWVLPLSGGYDSRAILCLLKNTKDDIAKLEAITWGTKTAQRVEGSDAFVAKKLAKTLKVAHTFYNTDVSQEPFDNVIKRFILLSEGRIDHIFGYLDGLHLWKSLYENGVEGIIRGDEGFGWNQVSSPLTIRISIGCPLCSDFSNLKDFKEYGFADQSLPEYMNRIDGESLNAWRDRLYHEFRLSTIISSLADLKLAYLEQVSPFLSRRILQVVRQMPDNLRNNKALFKHIVLSMSPDVEIAKIDAIASSKEVLHLDDFTSIIKEELLSDYTNSILPPDFISKVLNGLHSYQSSSNLDQKTMSLKSALLRRIPRSFKNIIRDKVSLPTLDQNILAFRLFIISKMNKYLIEDSQRLKE